MQPLVSAAQKSKTLSNLVAQGELDLSYANNRSLGPSGTQYQTNSPFINITGEPAGKSITFKQTSGSGFLYEDSYRFLCTYTIDATDVPSAPIAMNMVRDLQVTSNGNLIVFRTGEAILASIKRNKNVAFQTHALKYARMLKPDDDDTLAVAADTQFVTYLPRAETYLDEIEKALLTNVLGDVQVRITFHDTARSGLVTATGITSLTALNYSQTYSPEPSKMNQLIVKNWSKPSVMSWLNSDTEQVPLKTVTTLENYVFTTPYFVTRTDILIKKIKNYPGCPLARIKKIDNLTVGGIPYITDLPVSRLTSNASRRGVASMAPNATNAVVITDDMISINWDILCSSDQETGGIFFSQLRDTKISLTFENVDPVVAPAVPNKDVANAFFVHHYWNQVQFLPASGSNGYLSVIENS